MKNAAFLMLVCCLLAAPLRAQVPQILNYQGRISVGTANFSGSGQFEFALVNTNGSTFYWSNDGTNGQPTNAVTLTVTNGLYSVLLGDTTIANMTAAIPYSVFTNPDVRLRVWFNDGTHGNQQLGPDQRLSASGYALMAGGVDLPVTTSATNGTLEIGGTPFLHAYGRNGLSYGNTFVGNGAGNFTLGGFYNTAEGSGAMQAVTYGTNNTANGYGALYSNMDGSFNTATGSGALGAGEGSANVADGYDALGANSGNRNIAVGYQAGAGLTTGNGNIEIGNYGAAGDSYIIRIGDNQTDTYLTGIIHGNGSGLTGITSSGLAAGSVTNTQLAANSVTATDIVGGAVGSTQLASNLTLGGTTTLSGDLNLPATTSASIGALDIGGSPFLHAYGPHGLSDGNTFAGNNAGNFTMTGATNTGIGTSALYKNSTGTNGTAIGYQALLNNTTGSSNIGVGSQAGSNLTTGSNNIDLGNVGVAGESNIIRLGDGSTQTDTYLTGNVHASIATVSGTLTAGSTTTGINLNGWVGIKSGAASNTALSVQRFGSSEVCASFSNDSGTALVAIGSGPYSLFAYKLAGNIARSDNSSSWDVSSDERIKHDIKPVAGALATLERLRPVRFHYNADFLAKSGGTPDYERFGVVAQEFQKVFPDFVDTDKDGMLSVRMDPIPIVTAAAVQELDAQDKVRDATVANLQAENTALKKRLTDLEAALKKQVAASESKEKERDAKLAAIEELLRGNAQPPLRTASPQAGR